MGGRPKRPSPTSRRRLPVDPEVAELQKDLGTKLLAEGGPAETVIWLLVQTNGTILG